MPETAKETLKSVLDFCKGYEKGATKELSDDYYNLKKFVQQKYREVTENRGDKRTDGRNPEIE